VPAKDGDRLVGAYTSAPLSGTVERTARARGLSKSALIRRALVAYLLLPGQR
jgi:Ribbon-helix-helix protein, copG family